MRDWILRKYEKVKEHNDVCNNNSAVRMLKVISAVFLLDTIHSFLTLSVSLQKHNLRVNVTICLRLSDHGEYSAQTPLANNC